MNGKTLADLAESKKEAAEIKADEVIEEKEKEEVIEKIEEDKEFDKLVQISVAELLAHTIESIENNLPVSDVFTQFDFKG